MALDVIEVEFIELFITLIIFVSAYFLTTKVFHFSENTLLITSIFSLFIIFFLLALDYHLYTSFTVILLFSGLVIYSYFKKSSGGNEIEVSE